MHWEILWVLEDSPNLDRLLGEGWEPFATTVNHNLVKVWLRRQR